MPTTTDELELEQNQDVRTFLKVSAGLMALLQDRARREGVSPSKVMRRAIYRYLGIKRSDEK